MIIVVFSQVILLCLSLVYVSFTSPAPPVRPRARANHPDVTPTNDRFACVKWPTWVARNFVKEDCYRAIQHLYAEEVEPHGDQKYPVTARTTPKRFVSSTSSTH